MNESFMASYMARISHDHYLPRTSGIRQTFGFMRRLWVSWKSRHHH
jgi:hypothetical protein